MLLEQGLTMTGEEYWLVDVVARAELHDEVKPSDLDQPPWEICIHFTVTGYSKSSCWRGPRDTSSVWLHGFKKSQTPRDSNSNSNKYNPV